MCVKYDVFLYVFDGDLIVVWVYFCYVYGLLTLDVFVRIYFLSRVNFGVRCV